MTKKPRRLDMTAMMTRLLATAAVATTLLVAHTSYSDSGDGDASAVVAPGSGSASSAPVAGSGSGTASASGTDTAKAGTTTTETKVTTTTTTLPAAPGFGDIASAFGAGEYALATSLLIVMLVGLARSAGIWKQSKLGGWLLNFLGSFGAVLGTAALAHVKITYAVLGGTVITALSTAGLLELGRDVIDWWKARNSAPPKPA